MPILLSCTFVDKIAKSHENDTSYVPKETIMKKVVVTYVWMLPNSQETSIAGSFFGHETLCYNVRAYLV